MEKLLGNGIALGNIAAHLETDQGQKYFGKECLSYALPQGFATAIPNGKIIMIGSLDIVDNEHKLPQSFAIQIPYFDEHYMSELPQCVWKAIDTFNTEGMAEASPKKLWTPKRELWEKFREIVNKMFKAKDDVD